MRPEREDERERGPNRQPHPERARHVDHRLVRYRRGVPSHRTLDHARPTPPPTGGIDLDPRSAIPLAIAVALFAIAVWFIRSIPRTLSSVAIATLLAFALNPLVEALKRRTGWHRRTAAGVVLVDGRGRRRGRRRADHRARPSTRSATSTSRSRRRSRTSAACRSSGPRLREAKASEKVQQWLNDVPKHLSANSKPIENAAGAIADGVAAALFTILLAITILLDGEFIVGGVRRLVPARRRDDADRHRAGSCTRSSAATSRARCSSPRSRAS